MKKSAILLPITALLCAFAGPIGLVALAAFFLDLSPAEASFGAIPAAYPGINSQTAAQLAAENAQVREVLWSTQMVFGADANFDETPFANGMTGRIVAKERPDNQAMRQVLIEIIDTAKVAGNTVNIPLTAGIGGEGTTGDNTRRGSEAVMFTSNMSITIGKQFFACGMAQTAIDETVLGKGMKWNRKINDDLRKLHNRKKSHSVIMSMLSVARGQMPNPAGGAFSGVRNLLFPSGVTSRDKILSTSIVNTSLIQKAGRYLPSLGAVPTSYAPRDDAGSLQECFLYLSTDYALGGLATEPALLQARSFAADRGQKNRLFAGGLESWNGYAIYQWITRDHAIPTSMGNPLVPRARLGNTLTAINPSGGSPVAIYGGGLIRATVVGSGGYSVEPNWFDCFSNFQWVPYGGVSLPNPLTGTRHLAIISAGGVGFYTYTVNSGNTISLTGKYVVNSGTGYTQVYTHAIGDVIVEVNAQGVPFGASLILGQQAVAAGVGSINGSETNPELAKFCEDVQDYGVQHGIGAEAVWGCAPVQRALDLAFPNFAVVEHALQVDDSMPVITSTWA